MTLQEIKDSFDDYLMLDKKVYVDGGDSCQRTTMYIALFEMLKKGYRIKFPNLDKKQTEYIFSALQPYSGVIIRHPKIEWSASDWDRGSNDQTRPYLVGAGLSDPKQVKRYFKGHLKRGLLLCGNTKRNGSTKESHGEVWKVVDGKEFKRDYSNKLPDITSFEDWALYIRGMKLWYLYPLLLIFDLETLVSAIQNRYRPDDSDVVNTALIQLYIRHRYWTPWAWLCNKIHTEKMIIPKLERYFADIQSPGDNLKFFVEMFRCAYASVRGTPITVLK